MFYAKVPMPDKLKEPVMRSGLIRGIVSFPLILGAVSACVGNSEPLEQVVLEKQLTFMASAEQFGAGTKTVRNDDGSTWWNPAEEISVFYGSGSGGGALFRSTNTEQAATVEFSGSVQMTGSGKSFWAVYPYSDSNSCDGESVTTIIPSEQTASQWNFSNDAFPAIAESKTLDLAFWNICGGIKFYVSRNDIRSVTFAGNNDEPLAGKVRVGLAEDGKPYIKEYLDVETEVTLTAPEGETFKVGRYYYVSLLPGALSYGFNMTFTTANSEGTFVSDKAQEIKRSVFGVLKGLDDSINLWRTIVLTVPVESITLSETSATLSYGSSLRLAATVLPEDATNKALKWSSSDASVATVDAAGLVTALSNTGTADITATSVDNPEVYAECTISVAPPVVKATGISINPRSFSIYIGQTKTIQGTVSPSNATDKTVIWEPAGGAYVIVESVTLSNGVSTATVRGTKSGNTTLTAFTNDKSYQTTARITVSVNAVASIRVSHPNGITLKVGEEFDLEAEAIGADSSAAPSYPGLRWSQTGGVVMVINGHVTAINPGYGAITITSTDNPYKSVTVPVTVLDSSAGDNGHEGVGFEDWNFGEIGFDGTVRPAVKFNEVKLGDFKDQNDYALISEIVTGVYESDAADAVALFTWAPEEKDETGTVVTPAGWKLGPSAATYGITDPAKITFKINRFIYGLNEKDTEDSFKNCLSIFEAGDTLFPWPTTGAVAEGGIDWRNDGTNLEQDKVAGFELQVFYGGVFLTKGNGKVTIMKTNTKPHPNHNVDGSLWE